MRCDFAQWRGPVPNMTPGGMVAPVVGVVFHIMGASMAAADGWFHNPSAQASAHFGIGQDGALVQWVDTSDRAWHAMAANRHWIGVETEGSAGALSEAGCRTFGRLYAWLAASYHLPFVPTDDPVNGAGLGWHGMGGNAWGGHFYCPGDARKVQRQHVIDLAQGQPGPPPPPPPEDEEMRVLFTHKGGELIGVFGHWCRPIATQGQWDYYVRAGVPVNHTDGTAEVQDDVFSQMTKLPAIEPVS